MWSNYTKTFAFRDCFDEINVEGNVAAINKLLKTKQFNDEVGVALCTDLISTDTVTNFEAYKLEDTGEWNLNFYNGEYGCPPIATLIIDDCKEIQLQFEIEENLDTRDISIHHCTVKGFKEYQM